MRGEFAEWMREVKERSEATIYIYIRRWDFAEDQLGKLIQDLTTDDLVVLKRVMKQAGYSSAYTRACFIALRQVRAWGAATGKWKHNGVEHWPIPKAVYNSSAPLPIDKVRLILGVAEGPLEMRVTYVPAYAGLRISEATGLDSWEDGWLDFMGKGSKPRRVPAHPILQAKRDAILAHRNPSLGGMKEAKDRIQDKVGFPYVTHQLRKSFSTELHNGQVSDLCRKELLGHSTGLDGVYTLVSDREKQEAVAVLPY